MYVWMRYQTAAKAEAGAGRLAAKKGRGMFAVIDDRAAGGDFAPFAVVSAAR